MTTIKTRNPFTGDEIKEYALFTEEKIDGCLRDAAAVFPSWSMKPITE